jgi:4'-phosphopantetheinyl transferase EntD
MPLYKEWESDPYSLAAIWEINEPELFFIEGTGLRPDIKSEKRRMEHLAGRYLLKYLENDFPLHDIKPDIHDKPRLASNQFYFSISHSFPFVTAVVSPYVECGIDIQTWHPRMEQLQQKFLSNEEQRFFSHDPKLITLAWCTKEAAYKWQGRRGVEFSDHLILSNLIKRDTLFNINILLDLTAPKLNILSEGFIDSCFAHSVIVNRGLIHPYL